MMIRKCLFLISILTLLISSGSVLSADKGLNNPVGLRVGFGSDPDQFLMGLNSQLLQVSRNVYFLPSADVGFGSDVTIFSFNGDFGIPFFSPGKSNDVLYGSLGPTGTYYSFEGDSEFEVGFSVNFGYSGFKMGDSGPYNLEVRFGFGDIHDIKLLLGIWL